MALTTNLVEYWKLDEASGDRAGSHASKTLTDNNTVASGTGLVYGTAADFEASNANETLSRSGDAGLQMGDADFTIAMWFNAESLPADGGFMVLADKTGTTFEYRLFIAGAGGNQNLAFAIDGGGTFPSVGPSTDLSVGTWYLAIGWHDAGSNLIGCQLNTGTPATTASGGAGLAGTDPFLLGAASGGTFFFDGLMGPVMVWNRLLTSDEKMQLWNCGNGVTYADLTTAGSISFVNSTALTFATAASTWSIPTHSSRVGGAGFVVGIGLGSTSVSVSTITDNTTNVYRIATAMGATKPQGAELWYCPSISSASTRISVTLSGASSGSMGVGQFLSLSTNSPLLETGSSAIVVNSTSHSAAQITPSKSNALVVSFARMNASTLGTVTNLAGWATWCSTAQAVRTHGMYIIQVTASSATGSYTTSSNCQHAAVIAAFSDTLAVGVTSLLARRRMMLGIGG